MRILLIGEYSNVHATLADGLRELGHEVTVISNGDFWKGYKRDIDVTRKPGPMGGLLFMAKLYSLLPRMRNYDVVQLINPMFFELKAERLFFFYNYLIKGSVVNAIMLVWRFISYYLGMIFGSIALSLYRKKEKISVICSK